MPVIISLKRAPRPVFLSCQLVCFLRQDSREPPEARNRCGPLSSLPRCVASWSAVSPTSRCRSASVHRQCCWIGYFPVGRWAVVVVGAAGCESLVLALDWVPSAVKSVLRTRVIAWASWRDCSAIRSEQPRSSKEANRLQGAHLKYDGPCHGVAFSAFCEWTCPILGVNGRYKDTHLASLVLGSDDWRQRSQLALPIKQIDSGISLTLVQFSRAWRF